ncbi:MAG: hypothetical protein Fur0028_10080 [Bacteroidales bacterium]
MKLQFPFKNKHWLVLLLNFVLSITIILIVAPQVWFLSGISVYFFLLGLISSIYLLKKLKTNPNRFISQYMLVSMLRLMFHLIAIVLLFVFFKERFLIAGIFFLNYIISTLYEATQWLSTKNKS